ncbi:MAG: universal stress protein [Halobacteriota archaeon]
MTYDVLVPVDRTADRAENQAKYASRLAETVPGVTITFLHVLAPDTGSDPDDVSFSAIDTVGEVVTHLETGGLSIERSIRQGNVSEQIVRSANELDADEIVMGGRKRTGVTSVLLGSTVRDVVVSVDRPVTITGTNVVLGEGKRRVLVPVDTSDDRALRQVEYVNSLSNESAAIESTVLYVFPHLDYTGAPSHEFEEIDAAVHAAEYLEERGIAVDRVATGGEVARTIVEAADELDVDGIVMGGRKRSGVAKVLIGSTVMDVMTSATRPVTITG